jgi:hypothetical protein
MPEDFLVMNKTCYLSLVASCILLVSACGQPDDTTGAVLEKVTTVDILSYDEREAGTDIYPVRVLVSPAYVRLDDGYAASDFVLLDRLSKTVFSVNHEERSILVIENQPVNAAPPPELVLTETRTPDKEAPLIDGRQPVHVNYLANGEVCYQAVTVSGVMDTAVAAMAEYTTVLAERQLNNMGSVPESMQTPCFLSRYVYAPARHYRDGLPVQEWDDAGFFTTLTDYSEDKTVPAAVFVLPDEYERFSPGL